MKVSGGREEPVAVGQGRAGREQHQLALGQVDRMDDVERKGLVVNNINWH